MILGLDLGVDGLVVLALATGLAYFLKGFSGFGPALVFVPTVSVLLDPELALAGSALIDLVVGAGLLATFRYSPEERRLIARMVVAMAGGTIMGAALAGAIPPEAILLLIGVAVLGLGIDLALRPREELPAIHISGSQRLRAGCFAGGVTGGLVGISGPFVVGAVAGLDKSVFRRVLVAVFLVEQALKLAVYGAVGVWSEQALGLAVVAAPAIGVGLLAGYRLHLRVSQTAFRRVTGAILTLLAIRVLIEAL